MCILGELYTLVRAVAHGVHRRVSDPCAEHIGSSTELPDMVLVTETRSSERLIQVLND